MRPFYLVFTSLVIASCDKVPASVGNLVQTPQIEVEACQFIADTQFLDDELMSKPPGLDEELHCDHKCFLEELGPSSGDDVTLQQMYSIGWRLTHMEFARYNERPIWHVYFERPLPKTLNDCYRIYEYKTN